MIKELETKFIGKGQVRGFVFTQICKTDNGFIYEVDNYGNKYYEVFKKKLNTMYNNISYPTDKAFGIWAFTTYNLDKAKIMLNNLKNKKL